MLYGVFLPGNCKYFQLITVWSICDVEIYTACNIY